MAWTPQRALALLETQDSPGRIVPMEGMRGAAVGLVFLVHYFSTFKLWATQAPLPGLAEALFYVGHYGVDIFFALSGYLIYGAIIRKPTPYGAFTRRRLQRLYPTFAVVLGLYLALSQLFPAESKLPDGVAARIAYLAANALMLPGILPIRPIITVSWSLSFEIFFYVSVPLVVAGLRMRAWRPANRVLFIGAMAGALLLATRVLDLPLYGRMTLFASGSVAYEIASAARAWRPSTWLHALAVLLWIALLPVGFVLERSAALGAWAQFARTGWIAVALLMISLSTFSGAGPLAVAFAWRPMRWLGNMSYSYYLLHGLVLKALALVALRLAAGLGGPFFWLAMPLAFAMTVVVSFVLYAAIEYPFSLAPKAKPKPVPAISAAALVDRTVGIDPGLGSAGDRPA